MQADRILTEDSTDALDIIPETAITVEAIRVADTAAEILVEIPTAVLHVEVHMVVPHGEILEVHTDLQAETLMALHRVELLDHER